ncbi:MAG: recombinase family protein, partial [Candidatus Uhrbacteria bacterium]
MDISTKNNLEKAAELVARVQASFMIDKKDEEDEKNWRYVIYARKSTDDKSESKKKKKKQEQSIGDQIAECKKLADRLELRCSEIKHEEKSAKNSDNRPIFRAMLDDLRKGKYDGIITWAPDRLARNMKEGGEIIDMLDRGEIKDIKFANNLVFENDSAGKMLLGITFVMAKQYSDQHPQNVIRANNSKTGEGKWAGSHGKHGYWKDKNHRFLPDGENHGLISEAFRLRLEGRQLKDIAAFLIERGFPVATKHTKLRWTPSSRQYVDKFKTHYNRIYTSVLISSGQTNRPDFLLLIFLLKMN